MIQYIPIIAKVAGKKDGHFTTLESIYLLLPCPKFQNYLRGLVGDGLFSTVQRLSRRRKVSNLSTFYLCLRDEFSKEPHILALPYHSFQARISYAMCS